MIKEKKFLYLSLQKMINKHFILHDKQVIEERDLFAWIEWFTKADRNIKKTIVNDVMVSTVFLGINHSFNPDDILIFETMVFGGHCDGLIDRYCTYDEALEGHEKICSVVFKEANNLKQ